MRARTLTVVTPLLLLAGCGGADAGESAPPPAAPETPAPVAATQQQALEQTTAAAVANAQGTGGDPVPAAELESRLPDQLGGMPRTDRSSQDAGAMGVKMSVAAGRYQGDGKRIMLSITDTGTTSGAGPMAAAWTLAEFDRTTADGYERTIRHNGMKGMESLSRRGGNVHSELSVLAGNRFVVQLKGTGVEMDALKSALDELDLSSLTR